MLGRVRRCKRRSSGRVGCELYREVIANLVDRGAEGIILGCTSIGLLVHDDDARVPLFEISRIRAERAVELALT